MMCSRLAQETGRRPFDWLVGGKGVEEERRLEIRGARLHKHWSVLLRTLLSIPEQMGKPGRVLNREGT